MMFLSLNVINNTSIATVNQQRVQTFACCTVWPVVIAAAVML